MIFEYQTMDDFLIFFSFSISEIEMIMAVAMAIVRTKKDPQLKNIVANVVEKNHQNMIGTQTMVVPVVVVVVVDAHRSIKIDFAIENDKIILQ